MTEPTHDEILQALIDLPTVGATEPPIDKATEIKRLRRLGKLGIEHDWKERIKQLRRAK